MISLVIGDLHHKVCWVESFLDSQPFDEVILLGDYFDDYGDDDPSHSIRTAKWLKHVIKKYGDKLKVLLGNHDIPYRFPLNRNLYCSGWSKQKSDAINLVITPEDWAKFHLMYYTQGFLCTHAGVTDGLFLFQPEVDGLYKYCQASLEYAAAGSLTALLDAGRDRGGRATVGGLLWCDFKSFKPVEGLNQIFGHTPSPKVRTIKDKNSINYCIDTNAQHAAIIENGAVTIIETGSPYKGNNFMKGIPQFMGDADLKDWVKSLQEK